jgi:hypothetical protein
MANRAQNPGAVEVPVLMPPFMTSAAASNFLVPERLLELRGEKIRRDVLAVERINLLHLALEVSSSS